MRGEAVEESRRTLVTARVVIEVSEWTQGATVQEWVASILGAERRWLAKAVEVTPTHVKTITTRVTDFVEEQDL